MGIFDFLCQSSTSRKATTQDIQGVLDQLTEDEALTDGLEDEGASLLLQWAKEHIQRFAERNQGQDFDSYNRQLRLLLRISSRLAAQRQELSETEFLEQLTQLLDLAFSPPSEDE